MSRRFVGKAVSSRRVSGDEIDPHLKRAAGDADHAVERTGALVVMISLKGRPSGLPRSPKRKVRSEKPPSAGLCAATQ